jgi:hypothetical protein
MAKGTCSFDGCEEPIRNVTRGWCNKHYKSWQKYGDPLRATRQLWSTRRVPLAERFWAKVDKTGGCWLWTGTVAPNGYGRISMGSKYPGAHRVAYELLVGPIPVGTELDHLCRVRLCVKVVADEQGPAHLEAVTHAENIRRGVGWLTVAEMMRAKTHCPQGHPYDEANTYRWRGTGGRQCRACRRNG